MLLCIERLLFMKKYLICRILFFVLLFALSPSTRPGYGPLSACAAALIPVYKPCVAEPQARQLVTIRGVEAAALPSTALHSLATLAGLHRLVVCIHKYLTHPYHESTSMTEWLLCGNPFMVIFMKYNKSIPSIDSPITGRENTCERKYKIYFVACETNNEKNKCRKRHVNSLRTKMCF